MQIQRIYDLAKPITKNTSILNFIPEFFKGQEPLPKVVDLRPLQSPVKDQHDLGYCHDDKTEVLTDNGWKLFKDVCDNDKLGSVNPQSQELIFETPSGFTRYLYKGNLICSNKKAKNFKVTPNHRMIVRKWNEKERTLNNNYEFVEAKDLGWYSGLMNRISYNGLNNSDVYTLKGIKAQIKSQRMDKTVSMKLWLNLLGIYLAEGTLINEDCTKDRKTYRIQLAASKDREKNFIREVLTKLGINYCEFKDRFTFTNKQIYKELENLGTKVYAPFKFVPEFVFKQSSYNIKEFLLGYFMGDGCEDSSGCKSIYTSSEKMSNDLQRLIFLSGNESRISSRPPRTSIMKDGKIIKGNYNEYRISICENKNLSIERKEDIYEEYYEGEVFCAEMPTFHTLVTRREGKILISGNCFSFAAVGMREFLEIKNKQKFVPLSELYLGYKTKLSEGTEGVDNGATISDVMQALTTWGVCPESIDPYIPKLFSTPDSTSEDDAAKQYKISSYSRVNNLNELKAALAEGYVAEIGIMVYESLETEEVMRTGRVPYPNKQSEQLLGGHAVLIVAYNDITDEIIFKNSWGVGIGINGTGYFSLPYKFMNDPDLVSEMYVGKL